MTFLSRDEYFAEITQVIASSGTGDDIMLGTMSFDNGDRYIALVNAMTKASKNGAKVRFAIDSYNYIIDRNWRLGPLFWHKSLPSKKLREPFESLRNNLSKLSEAGINVNLLNPVTKPLTNPFAGRSHIKYCVINNLAYIGGCNLSSSRHIDIMAKSDNKNLVKAVREFAQEIINQPTVYKAYNSKDQIIKINKELDLLVDAGVKKQSLIYDKALELIDNAKEYIFMTSQYPPHSKTAKHLTKALKRGVKIELLYNSPSQHPKYIKLLQSAVKKYNQIILPKELFANELPTNNLYMHGKILISESQAMIGSHNFSTHGVNFGTAEFCLHLRIDEFNTQIIKSIKDQIIS